MKNLKLFELQYAYQQNEQQNLNWDLSHTSDFSKQPVRRKNRNGHLLRLAYSVISIRLPMTDREYKIENALIAEDDDDDFECFAAAVEEISIAIIVTRATDGDTLMKKLFEITPLPDILFLDILMPCLDGKSCLKNIRSNKKFDNLPIIMFSSLEDSNSLEYCFRERSNFFLQKPSSMKTLVQALKNIFRMDWTHPYYLPISQFLLPKTYDE